MSFKNIKVFALIPARKNSTGIKDKNIYKIHGKPLIDFTLDAAIQTLVIDQVFVSSDSDVILSHVSKSEGINPLKRPAKFATNKSTASDVVSHFIKFIDGSNHIQIKEDFYIIYLQPTSPLRDTEIINQSFQLLRSSNSESLISLVQNEFSPYKSFLINEEGFVKSLFDQSLSNLNRQNLPKTYRANGAIYIFKASEFIKLNGFPSNNSIPFIMDDETSIDIDSYEEIDLLKLILTKRSELQ